MSVLLEVLGRGLESDLREVLRPLYWTDWSGSAGLLVAPPRGGKPAGLDEGLARWRDGDLMGAHNALQSACQHGPGSLAARAALACVADDLGDTADALAQLRALLRLLPEDPRVQFAAGLCHEKAHQLPAAAVHYRRAVATDETHTQARRRLAAVALATGHLNEAIAEYEALCRITPEDSWLRTSLAALHYRAGEFRNAAETFETVIAMEPGNWSLEDDCVQEYIASGNVRRAIEHTQASIEEQGPFADLYLRLANLYSLIGDDGPAMRNYLEALDLQPNYMEAVVKMATHHLLFGRWEEAAEAFGRAACLSDQLLVNYAGLAISQRAMGDDGSADQTLRLVTGVEPNSTLLHAQMIRLHWQYSLHDDLSHRLETRRDLQTTAAGFQREEMRDELSRHVEAIEVHADRADVRYHCGILLRAAGQFDESLVEFRRAVALHPTFVPARIKLAVAMEEMGLSEQTDEFLTGVLDLTDDQVGSHYRLAIRFAEGGQLRDLPVWPGLAPTTAEHLPHLPTALALSLVDLGLLDREAATWRTLGQTHRIRV